MSTNEPIVIIGGGIIGSTLGLFLASSGFGGRVLVLEPDATYRGSSTARSASAIRTQFNLGINVAMASYGYSFFKNATKHLSLGGEVVDVAFVDKPYLVLAARQGVNRLRGAFRRQIQNGADVELLEAAALRGQIPWLKTRGIAAATLGRSKEGWLDPLLALNAIRAKAETLGVTYLPYAVERIVVANGLVKTVVLSDDSRLDCSAAINAAGAQAAAVAAQAGISLPIEGRKRTAFVFASATPPADFVQVIDPTYGRRGVYCRPYGEAHLAVTSPSPFRDVSSTDMDPDLELFDSVIRPALARRVRGLEQIELIDTWAGHYEMNTFDQNAIIGRHPAIRNFLLACGLSGHGVMHAPAIGRGIAELLTTGAYQTLDLTPFRFERIAENQPLDDVQASEHRVIQAGM